MNEWIGWLPPGLHVLPRYVVAIALGLLMGLERERNPAALAGLRTFALTALFGTLAAHLAAISAQPWLIAVGLLLAGAMMITAYMRPMGNREDSGTTTVAALMLCYGLGVLIWFNEIQLAVMLAIATTTLLYFKPELRGISQRLSRKDILSILQFGLLALIILPLLPNKNFGPYGALNPYQIWWVVVLIVGVGLAGYAALRRMGQRGVIVIGLLGGMVSSTATTLAFSRHARSDEAMARVAVIVIVLANLVVLFRLGVIAAIMAPDILRTLYPIFAGGLTVGAMGAWYGFRRLHPHNAPPELTVTNPTEMRTALGFAVLYAIVLLLSAWLSDVIGNAALYGLALVSGLTDLDAITLSTLRLFNLGKVPAMNVVNVILLALLANLVFKSVLTISLGGWTKMRHAVAGMGAVALGLIIAWLIMAAF
ncbi:MAG: MgtC/SapB family protein [Thiobacillus sp.]